MNDEEYEKFLEKARTSAKDRTDDASNNLNLTLRQVAYWKEQARIAQEHYESCKTHYEATLTWGQPIEAQS